MSNLRYRSSIPTALNTGSIVLNTALTALDHDKNLATISADIEALKTKSGHTIQDEGVALPASAVLNFTGPGITVTDVAGVTTLAVPGMTLGETSSTAYRGDRGKAAYDHYLTPHAPSNAVAAGAAGDAHALTSHVSIGPLATQAMAGNTAIPSITGLLNSTTHNALDHSNVTGKYVHPTTDGNLHVPVTGTTHNGMVLTAGSADGVISWQTPSTAQSVGGLTGIATVAPLAAGVAAVGISTLGARQDHVHSAQTIPTALPNTSAVTFAATGGAAAGSTYIGSSAVTVDYHTIGAAALAGSSSQAFATGALTVTGSVTATSTGGTTSSFTRTDGVYTVSMSGLNTTVAGALGMSVNDMVLSVNGTERVRVASTGLAVTGAISSTAQALFGGATSTRMLGVYGSGEFKDASGISTTIWSEAATGKGGVGTNSNHPFSLLSNGSVIATVSSTGLSVTGAISATGATQGALTLAGSSNVSATSEPANLSCTAPNASGTSKTWSQIRTYVVDATNASEDSSFIFTLQKAGTPSDIATISSTGLTVTGNISATNLSGTNTGDQSGGDATANIGYLNIPQNSRSAAYTCVLSDAGKHILHPSADTTARIFYIPGNTTGTSPVAYPVGTAITIVNQNGAGDITIQNMTSSTDTIRLAGTGTTTARTLKANGVATLLKIATTEWIISGTNLT